MGDIDSTKKFAGYIDPVSAIGGKPLMVAKQIYDKIFFSLMSGVEDWEKSLIDDLLKKDGLLDERDYSNDYNGGELTEVLLNLADIALTLADKGGAASEISGNLYVSAGKKASKEAKKEVVKDAVSEVGEKALKKEAGEAFENALENSRRTQLLDKVSNQKLKNTINEMYRPGAKQGDGGLADAIRYELKTNELIGGKSHIRKGIERLKNLENILAKQNLNSTDKNIVNDLIDDLRKALEGK